MAISIGDVFAKLGLDTGEFNRSLEQSKQSLEGFVKNNEKNFRILGAAFTAVGAAGLKMVGDARQMNAQMGSTALTIGKTTKELRDMVLETTNVTFGVDSVIKTFDNLARAGMRDIEQIRDSANAFDALADAINSSADVVSDTLIPAFKAMGVDLPTTAEEMDRFTWLVKNTTTDLNEFGMAMNYVAMYGEGLGVTLDEMVAIMAVLESKGKGGATATRLFRTAVNQAKDGTVTLNEALGITEQELEKYRTEMAMATGMTQSHADEMNKQFGIMDKLKQKWSEFTLSVGSILTPLESVFGLMTALGPALIVLSTEMGRSTIKTVAHTASMVAHRAAMLASVIVTKAVTAAQWLWNAALTANPIGLVIAAIGGLVAAGIALWKNWDKVVAWMRNAWSKIKIIFLSGVMGVLDNLSMLTKFIPGLNKIIDQARDKISGMIEAEKLAAEFDKVGDAAQGFTRKINTVTAAVSDAEREIIRLNNALVDNQAEQEKITTDIESLKSEYDDVKNSSAGYNREIEQLNRSLDNHQYELDIAQRKLDSIKEKYDESVESVNNFEQAIEDANRTINELSTPKLEGMAEYENQIWDIEQAMRELELAQLQGQISEEEYKRQSDALRDQRRELELTRDIKFEPLLKEFEKLTDKALGLDAELTEEQWREAYQTALSNRAEALKGLQDAQIALANNTSEYEAQSLTVKSIETDMEAIEVRLTDIDNIIRNTLGEVTDKLYEAEDIQSRLIKQAEEWMAALSKAEEEAAHVKMEEPAMSIVDKLNASVPLQPVFQPVQGVSDTQTPITNNFNLTGMIVREEADIQRIARELYIMQQMGANGG